MNAESSIPQDPDFYRQFRGTAWREMGKSLTARPSRRVDVHQINDALPDTPFLFCPLQVPDDSQVRLFAGWTRDYTGFITALTEAVPQLPQGWHLRLKEHPSAKQSLADMLAPLLATGRAVLDNSTDSFAQLAASQGVVTLNSSMGLQAFFHDKPVITLGRAFFAMPGLVTPCTDQATTNAAFATPQPYDPALRDGFMTWLDGYYPRFSEIDFDRTAFKAKLDQSRLSHDNK